MIPISWLYSTGKEEKNGWKTVLTLKSTDPNFILRLELKTNFDKTLIYNLAWSEFETYPIPYLELTLTINR